jgi:hypothetical protein
LIVHGLFFSIWSRASHFVHPRGQMSALMRVGLFS